jgi:transcriptional regulator with XRE-family HTH domain
VIDGELGAFLRTRRETLTPADVGLPPGTRRRAKGLRRSEVAVLAGISVEYLTRLEQGHDTHPSTQVLGALAVALRLNTTDRSHLQELATASHGTELLCPGGCPTAQTVRDPVRLLLDQLDPVPAYVVNRLGDLLAWNDCFESFARPIELLHGDPPNLVRFVFEQARAREVIGDWPAMASETLARLHRLRQGDPAVQDLVDDLAASVGTEFTSRWDRRPLAAQAHGSQRWEHPDVGPLHFHVEVLALPDPDHQEFVVHQAADEQTAAALDRLVGRRPGALRSVHTA